MFLPIGDEPNLPGRPVMTWVLIAVNVAVYVLVSWPLSLTAVDPNDPAVYAYLQVIGPNAGVPLRTLLSQLSAYDLFIFEHGFKAAAPSVADLFTSMFLHAGWMTSAATCSSCGFSVITSSCTSVASPIC
jgi:membrane associated rhomboid family serine protease